MARERFLVVDCGTSSCRASLVSLEGEVLEGSREPVEILSPEPGFAEVDPDAVWAAVVRRVRELLDRAGPVEILALGVSAMTAWVFLGADSLPVTNSPIWMDARGADEARRLLELFPERELYLRTGRRAGPEFPAMKLRWLAERMPAVFGKVTRLISLKDEIVRRFTGAVQIDPAHFNYSFLCNVRTGKPDADILRALGLPAGIVPEIRMPAETAGVVGAEAARAAGLRQGLPVAVGASDGTSAIHAAGIYEPGASVLVSGTTDTFMTFSGAYPEDPAGVVTVNTAMSRGGFLAGGAMGMSGGALEAVSALLGVRFEECEADAGAVPPGSEGLLAFPGLTGERSPFWKDRVRGGFVGLAPRHGRAHLLRAVMEASAYRTALLLERLKGCGLEPSSVTVVGGGSRNDLWNRIRADAAGLPLVALREAEATTLGTAVFCRVALDPSASLASVAAGWRRERARFLPDPAKNQFYRNEAARFGRCVEALDRACSTPPPASI